MDGGWRERAASSFACEKRPATGARGMVVTNHPLASAAGAEMLAAGGNAIDATIAALFTLTVVEPMMVGIFGGGTAHIRLADGRHVILDGLSTAPLGMPPDAFRSVPDAAPNNFETIDRENATGPKSVATPGTLKGWCEALQRYGTMSLADVMEPAIRHASRGFVATGYLSECVGDAGADMARDPEVARLYLPGGERIAAGTRHFQRDYADSLRTISQEGPDALYGGALGRTIVDYLARVGGMLTLEDLTSYRTIEREPVRGTYRGVEVVGPPPPASAGVHIVQMLNVLEGYDLAGMGFGSVDALHLAAEVMKIAFADRAAATADPAFVDVPVSRLIDKAYAAERRSAIEMARAKSWSAGVAAAESPNTTHLTVADHLGNVVASTQTINSLFGARMIVPGTGILLNNYMHLFDPRPGRTLSIAPGKRLTTSQSPMMVLEGGKPRYALGLPGGLRIFGVVMQAIVNLVDHGMTLQEAVEAPRLWTQGQDLFIEPSIGDSVRAGLAGRGHTLSLTPHVAGGMNAIAFERDGTMTGAACWRADGTAVGIGGGYARAGARFWPDAPKA